MTLRALPPLDQRTYDELRTDALARIPAHVPEWTNPSPNDPGVALIELFAHLTESLTYFAGQGALRCRDVFFTMLGIRRSEARAARGLVELALPPADRTVRTITAGSVVRAGAIPFRITRGLTAHPIEAVAYVKVPVEVNADQAAYYRRLYATHDLQPESFYEPQRLDAIPDGRRLSTTLDSRIWVALLARSRDLTSGATLEELRATLAGQSLTLAVSPVLDPNATTTPSTTALFEISCPNLDIATPRLDGRPATYRRLAIAQQGDPRLGDVLLEVQLPDATRLGMWALDPLEAGLADLPPSVEGTDYEGRVLTWLQLASPVDAIVRWVGINTTTVEQTERIVAEAGPVGDGSPDQEFRLRRTPVVPSSIRLTVTPAGTPPERWTATDDILTAPGEADDRAGSKRFMLDAADGLVRFGDGLSGHRLPIGAGVDVDYSATMGTAGNLPADSFDETTLAGGRLAVRNPLPTWGGADAESADTLERRMPAFVRHRDRLVTAADGVDLAMATPGVRVGRAEVLGRFHPDRSQSLTGDEPGVMTVFVIPDGPVSPALPLPAADGRFLRAVCDHLEPRRLITTELVVRGPIYVPVWVSLAVTLLPGMALAEVSDDIRRAVTIHLSPLPPANDAPSWARPMHGNPAGWPLGTTVSRAELAAVVARVPGVRAVGDLRLAGGTSLGVEAMPINGLQLPELRAIAIVDGTVATPLTSLQGSVIAAPVDRSAAAALPIIPEDC